MGSTEKLDVTDTPISQTFIADRTRSRMIIPPFQREYSWGEDQIEDFWMDNVQSLERSGFIGSILVNPIQNKRNKCNDFEVKNFVDKHERLPKNSTAYNKGPRTKEDLLANKLNHLKGLGRNGKLSQNEIKLALSLPGFTFEHKRDIDERKFVQGLEKLWNFIVIHKRYPHPTASSKEERYLAGFRAGKKQAFGLGVSKNQEARFMELENKIKEYLVKEVGGRRYLRKYSRRLFKDWLPLLKEYIKQTGNNSVPSRTIFNGENLGRWWMNSIMMRYRKGILNKEHEQQLRGLGMDLDKAKGSSSRRKQVSNT